ETDDGSSGAGNGPDEVDQGRARAGGDVVDERVAGVQLEIAKDFLRYGVAGADEIKRAAGQGQSRRGGDVVEAVGVVAAGVVIEREGGAGVHGVSGRGEQRAVAVEGQRPLVHRGGPGVGLDAVED